MEEHIILKKEMAELHIYQLAAMTKTSLMKHIVMDTMHYKVCFTLNMVVIIPMILLDNSTRIL